MGAIAKSSSLSIFAKLGRPLDYSDGDYFVGAVYAFLRGTEITVNAMWSANPNTQRTGLEVLQSIRRDIGNKAKEK